MTTFSAFGGILFGYDTGVISGIKEMKAWLRQFGFVTDDLKKHSTGYAISSSTESLVVSILSAGTFVGALLGAPAAGKPFPLIPYSLHVFTGPFRYPRKKMGYHLCHSRLLHWYCYANRCNRYPTIRKHTRSCSIINVASSACIHQVVGRVFAGLGVGLVSVLIPMYQSEWYTNTLLVILFIYLTLFPVPPNGSVAPSFQHTSGPLLSVSFSPPLSTTRPRTATPLLPTKSLSLFNSHGLLSWPSACSSCLNLPVGSSSVAAMQMPQFLFHDLWEPLPTAPKLKPSSRRSVPTTKRKSLSESLLTLTASSSPRTRSSSAR